MEVTIIRRKLMIGKCILRLTHLSRINYAVFSDKFEFHPSSYLRVTTTT